MSNDPDGYSFDKLIHHICARPKVFTMNGTFSEVAAFLEGFAGGLVTGNPSLGKEMWVDGPRKAAEWLDFSSEWLPRRLQYPRNYLWWPVLWERYPDDQTALEQLRSLYLEFGAEKDSQQEV